MNIPHQSAVNLFDMTGKSVIVTGSGYGLGREMALGLASVGAQVVVSGRTESRLKETVEEITRTGGQAAGYVFDATDKGSCEKLISVAVNHFGKLDAMIINHGVIAVAKPEDTTEDEWSDVINVNLTSCFYCAQAAGKQLITQGCGGSIVMTSSNGSLVGFDGLSAYGASKGGVDQLCRQLASEWGRHNIRVNTINPGYTTNRMGGRPQETINELKEQEIKEMTPLQRRGESSEFVGPVIFLVSDASSFVSGHCLTVDGGYCAR